jgi:hypothetical protein
LFGRDDFREESSEIHRHHADIEFLTGLLAIQTVPEKPSPKRNPNLVGVI